MKNIITTVFLLVASVSLSQVNIQFQNTIGGIAEDYISGIKYIPDLNGYILIGTSNSIVSGDKISGVINSSDNWIVLTDSLGNIIWDKTYGSYTADKPYDCVLKNDTLFVLCESGGGIYGDKSEPGYGLSDIWLLAININSGDLLWERSYGGNKDDFGGYLITVYAKLIDFNNELIIATTSVSDISGTKTIACKGGRDYWLLNVDTEDGSILNENVVGSNGNDFLTDIKYDGNKFYLAGVSEYGNGGDKSEFGYGAYDYWIVSLDQNLQVIDNKVYGGDNTELEPQILIRNNALYISGNSRSGITGNKTSEKYGGFSDVWCLKLNKNNLNKIWEKSYGGEEFDKAYTLFYDNEKDLLVLGGKTNSSNSGTIDFQIFGMDDGWLFYLDTNGYLIDQFNYGGTGNDKIVAISKSSSDNSLSLAISTNSGQDGNKDEFSQGSYDYWLVNLIQTSLKIENSNTQKDLFIYPNPTNGIIKLFVKNKGVLKLFDLNGRCLNSYSLKKGTNIIELKTEIKGTYIYQVLTRNTIYSNGKLVVY